MTLPNENNSSLVDSMFEPLPNQVVAGEDRGAPTPQCLTFARARLLTLDPARTTGDETRHLAGCHRCTHLRGMIEREMPHVSTWLLIRRRLGLPLLPSEEHTVEYHLEAGGCRECRRREAALADRLPRLVRLGGKLPVPMTRAVGASVPTTEVGSQSADGSLEAELVLERGRMGLELRTRSPHRRHQLVGWTLATRREREADERFAVLQPDVEGWFVDHAWLDVKRLRLGPQNQCEEILAVALEPEHLGAPQRQRLLQSVRNAAADQRVDWKQWAEEQRERDALHPDDQQLLAQVLELAQAS